MLLVRSLSAKCVNWLFFLLLNNLEYCCAYIIQFAGIKRNAGLKLCAAIFRSMLMHVYTFSSFSRPFFHTRIYVRNSASLPPYTLLGFGRLQCSRTRVRALYRGVNTPALLSLSFSLAALSARRVFSQQPRQREKKSRGAIAPASSPCIFRTQRLLRF